jgi:hypothetical protein
VRDNTLKHHSLETMNDKHLYFLLDTIQKNGDARRLMSEGLTYKDIAELTQTALRNGLLKIGVDKKLSLTTTGIQKYGADDRRFKKTDKNLWIRPQTQSKTSKIDKNDIFLPDKNELSF